MTRYVFRDVVLGFKNSHKADAQVIGETIAGIAVERGGEVAIAHHRSEEPLVDEHVDHARPGPPKVSRRGRGELCDGGPRRLPQWQRLGAGNVLVAEIR